MDVLTGDELRVQTGLAASRLPFYSTTLIYLVVVGAVVMHHEPWTDEAQAWLLARDASLVDLWTRLLHYEGTTGLWQTLLHCLIQIGVPYAGMNIVSGLLGLAAAALLVWRSPFPLALRIVLPFTFFLCYQYVVIARSYTLLPLLLFCCAALYDRSAERPLLFTIVLCLLAGVSVHGMALAVAAGMAALIGCRNRKRFVGYIAGFIVVVVLLAASARPASDGTFISGLNLSVAHFLDVSLKAFANAFTGEAITSLLVVGLSIPLLWAGGGGAFFLFASVMLCGIASVIYSQVWHHGVLFLAWLFAIWISWPRSRQTAKDHRLPYNLALASIIMIAAVQIYWTACSIYYDWRQPYSGSLAAAQGLRELNLQQRKVFAIGFACTAIEPYFSHNIFANMNDGRPEAYWDWSRRNHVNQDSRHLDELRPDYVMVGYKNEFERGVWTDLVRKSGYRILRHFEGNSFWQTRVLEPESYDLFGRRGEP